MLFVRVLVGNQIGSDLFARKKRKNIDNRKTNIASKTTTTLTVTAAIKLTEINRPNRL